MYKTSAKTLKSSSTKEPVSHSKFIDDDVRDVLLNIRRELTPSDRENLKKYIAELDKFKEESKDGKKMVSPFSMIQTRNELMPEELRRVSLRAAINSKLRELPTEEDIQTLTAALEASTHTITTITTTTSGGESSEKMITFEGLNSVLQELNPQIKRVLQPATYFMAHSTTWPPKRDQCLPIYKIVDFLNLKCTLKRYELGMAWYDDNFTGCLTKEQLMKYYVEQVMPNIKSLEDLEEPLLTCYLYVVQTMFFFFLDPHKSGKVTIAHVLTSGLLENAFSLMTLQDCDSWFSLEKTMELSTTFKHYASGPKSHLRALEFYNLVAERGFIQPFVRRMFDVYVAKEEEGMSYEEFIVFQIAYDHIKHYAAITYFFRVLDADEDGFLTCSDINYFYEELAKEYNSYVMADAMPLFADFCDQMFDLVGPNLQGKISLADLRASSLSHEFVRCITNYKQFHNYEMREADFGMGGGSLEDDTTILGLLDPTASEANSDVDEVDGAENSDSAKKDDGDEDQGFLEGLMGTPHIPTASNSISSSTISFSTSSGNNKDPNNNSA